MYMRKTTEILRFLTIFENKVVIPPWYMIHIIRTKRHPYNCIEDTVEILITIIIYQILTVGPESCKHGLHF
jgi:hypothetical protein